MASTANPKYATLTPDVATTIDFTDLAFKLGPLVVKVTTDGAVSNRVYFTTDGSTPSTDGDNNWCLLGGQAGWKTAEVTPSGGSHQVKLLSHGAAWVCVEAYARPESA